MDRLTRYAALAAFLLATGSGESRAAKATDFSLPDVEGQRVNLGDLLDRGPVLLDFWATWCKPCVKSMPKMVKLHESYRERGLTVLGVNVDGPRSQAKVRPFLQTRGITFPVVVDADGAVSRRFHVRAIPTTVLIGPDSEIVYSQVGAGDQTRLLKAIEALLPEPATPDEAEEDVADPSR